MWRLQDMPNENSAIIRITESMSKDLFKAMLLTENNDKNPKDVAIENNMLEYPIEAYEGIMLEVLEANMEMVVRAEKNPKIKDAIVGKMLGEIKKRKINPDMEYIKEYVMYFCEGYNSK